jgi:hypothetical protein
MQVSLDIIVALLEEFVAVPLTWYFSRQKNNTDSVKAMMKCTHLLNQYNRMNEVVAELEIVKKTNYDIQKQFNEQSLAYAKEVEISQNWKSYTKNYLQNTMN